MANDRLIADEEGGSISAQPTIRNITPQDLWDAMAKGLADFMAMPTHIVFLCIIYPIVTLVMARVFAGYDVLPLVFPLLAGYTLIGPLVAIGMYELSRRRELGLDISRAHAFDVLRYPSIRSIALLGGLLMLIYFIWLGIALGIYNSIFGGVVPDSIGGFAQQILFSSAGWTLIIVGSGAGFIFSVVVLSLSVVSFPMLLDRNVGVMLAVQTSIRAVLANPISMGLWGIVVAATLLCGSLPFFVGLAGVLPVLGHATWHLYRKVVEF